MSTSVLRNVIQPRQTGLPGAASAAEKAVPPEDGVQNTQELDQVLAVLVENAPVAMALFDQQMRYLLANRAWIEEFGLKQVRPLMGRSQYEVFPSLHPGWRQVYEKALQGHIIRSEHDALASDEECRVIYRWEVRPWRRQADAGVGGLMITCERFVQPSADKAAAAEASPDQGQDMASAPVEPQPQAPEVAVPQVRLNEQGIILQANPAAARLSLAHGLHEGKTTFGDAFADGPAAAAALRRELTACMERLAQPEGPESVILCPQAAEQPASPWPMGQMRQPPTPWLLTRHEGGAGFTALALPPEAAAPRFSRPPPDLSAIASAVASIAQPPAMAPEQGGGSQVFEIRRLQDDLARAKQELRQQQEAGSAGQASAKRLESCLDTLPCGVLMLDEMGAVVLQNQPLARLLGRPLQHGETVEDWLAAACPGERHREQVASLWREDVWRRQLTRCFSLATTDGLLKELEFQPARLPDGGLLLCIQDATEKCRHEELLRATEAKFRAILQESPTAIILLDKTGSVFEVNHAAERLFSQPKSELRRHPLQRWLDVPGAAALSAALQQPRAEARTLEHVSLQTAEGLERVPASMRLAPVLDAEGKPHSTICFLQNEVTAPADMSEALPQVPGREVLLLKTNVNGRIKEHSPRALRLLGLDAEQARGRSLHLHFRPSDATGFYCDLGRLAARPDGPPLALACYSSSGGRQMLSIRARPLGAGGYDFAILEVVPAADSTIQEQPASTQQTAGDGDGWMPVITSQPRGAMPTVDLARERLVLTETHHRIKNHLQIISSLLNLESNTISDPAARGALRSSQNRVRAIADLHQHLYQAALGSEDSFIVFARGLLDRLRQCYDVPASRVNVQFDVESGAVQQEWLMPLALTLNETLSNCFEHAFPEGRSGLVHVALRFRKDKGELNITDDGIGMNADRGGGGLGLKILAVFAEQMRGQLLLGRPATGGTEVLLRFPVGGNA